VRVLPREVHEQVAGTDELQRLARGDVLDLAMYGTALLGTVVGAARAAGATRVELAVDGAGDVHEGMARVNGLTLDREILQLRCDLPRPDPWSLDVRPFEVGRDDDAWLVVNNRAFAWHPDQSDWRRSHLAEREAEDWFDPAGFLLHERDGRLAGFCWTKVHSDERPALGEIYVIGVDPDFQGLGLGRASCSPAWRRSPTAPAPGHLYVESDNTTAIALTSSSGSSGTRPTGGGRSISPPDPPRRLPHAALRPPTRRLAAVLADEPRCADQVWQGLYEHATPIDGSPLPRASVNAGRPAARRAAAGRRVRERRRRR
jgi:mycothiol synthase